MSPRVPPLEPSTILPLPHLSDPVPERTTVLLLSERMCTELEVKASTAQQQFGQTYMECEMRVRLLRMGDRDRVVITTCGDRV